MPKKDIASHLSFGLKNFFSAAVPRRSNGDEEGIPVSSDDLDFISIVCFCFVILEMKDEPLRTAKSYWTKAKIGK